MAPCNSEPSLDDLLRAAPIRLLMKSDGVEETALRRLLLRIKQTQGQWPVLDGAAAPAMPPAAAYRPRHSEGWCGCPQG